MEHKIVIKTITQTTNRMHKTDTLSTIVWLVKIVTCQRTKITCKLTQKYVFKMCVCVLTTMAHNLLNSIRHTEYDRIGKAQ